MSGHRHFTPALLSSTNLELSLVVTIGEVCAEKRRKTARANATQGHENGYFALAFAR
jgi:hypothetical protein